MNHQRLHIGNICQKREELQIVDERLRLLGIALDLKRKDRTAAVGEVLLVESLLLCVLGDRRMRAAGVDVYVTSDLRHHPVTDAIEQARYEASMRAAGIPLGSGDARTRPCFINTPHSAIESMWFHYAVEDVPAALERDHGARVETNWIRRNTDPWTFCIVDDADDGKDGR